MFHLFNSILSWSPFIKVQFTKRKLYLWYWCIIGWRRRYTSLDPIKFYLMHFYLFSCFKIWTLSFVSFGFSFLFKLCNLLFNNLWYFRLFSYGSYILWCFFNYKCFIYAIKILYGSPLTKVRYTKWKLFLS